MIIGKISSRPMSISALSTNAAEGRKVGVIANSPHNAETGTDVVEAGHNGGYIGFQRRSCPRK